MIRAATVAIAILLAGCSADELRRQGQPAAKPQAEPPRQCTVRMPDGHGLVVPCPKTETDR